MQAMGICYNKNIKKTGGCCRVWTRSRGIVVWVSSWRWLGPGYRLLEAAFATLPPGSDLGVPWETAGSA
jgi:hypothetical protein